MLGEDRRKILAWIANGWIRDRLQDTQRHNGYGNNIHRIREKNILRLLKNRPQEFHLGSVDQLWFLDNRYCTLKACSWSGAPLESSSRSVRPIGSFVLS